MTFQSEYSIIYLKPKMIEESECDSMIINGNYTDAVVYGSIIGDEAVLQIRELCSHPAFEGASVCIMPDCHAGKGCVIGFTSVSDKRTVIPNVVGVDIGCGILSTVFSCEKNINYKALDEYIRENIPSSINIRSDIHPLIESNTGFTDRLSEVCSGIGESENISHHLLSLGTLGGGNHFIEIDRISENEYILLVHTGSRYLGKKTCNYYQNHASVYDEEMRRSILSEHRHAVTKEEHDVIDRKAASAIQVVSRELAFLTGEKYDEYVNCVIFAREYAALNRELISDTIIDFLSSNYGISVSESFDTVHNYIDWYDKPGGRLVIRKGAVSALCGEKLVIPLNMKDGAIIAEGRGNTEWNNSAPHGAGRLMSRSDARKTISLEEFSSSMEGINTWSVCSETIDESPQAYKPAEGIIRCVSETVRILTIAKPVYNFKAS